MLPVALLVLTLEQINNVTSGILTATNGGFLYPCLGNEDVAPDYQQQTNSSYDEWLALVAQIWNPILTQVRGWLLW